MRTIQNNDHNALFMSQITTTQVPENKNFKRMLKLKSK